MAHFVEPDWSASYVLLLQFGMTVATWFVSGVPSLLRSLIPQHRSQGAAERAAELAFLEHSVFATRGRTGVLIMLSELEHKVVILGDEGIHARVQTSGWHEHVAHLGSRIRAGKSGEGLCEVINRLGRRSPPRCLRNAKIPTSSTTVCAARNPSPARHCGSSLATSPVPD